MTKVETVTCRECGWKGTVAHCEPIAPRYLPERVAVGDVMPAGECPECGANAMLDEQRQRMGDLRPEMEALMLDLDQLHRNIYSGRLRAPIGAYVKQLADSARRALAAGPPIRPVCNACGGTNVRVDAWARWDTRWQRWELHSTCEAVAICADCDLECSYAMKPFTEAA